MRKYRRLTRADRIAIERKLEQGKNHAAIAADLNVNRSTISREIKRNKAVHSRYKWKGAQAKANQSRPMRMFYPRKIEGMLENIVEDLLGLRLSPEQISNRLKLEKPKLSVSHETIYKWIYNVSPEHVKCLRWKPRLKQKRSARRRRVGKIPNRLIDFRPETANRRIERGHWERDLLEGRKGGAALLVIVDRKTRYTIIKKVKSRSPSEVNLATAEALKDQVVKTITNDNGIEFGRSEELENIVSAPVYFCHPYTSWERGSVENTNGLLRQFAPKRTNFDQWKTSDVSKLQRAINERPRKTHGFRSAAEVYEGRRLQFVKSERYYRKLAHKKELDYYRFIQEMVLR